MRATLLAAVVVIASCGGRSRTDQLRDLLQPRTEPRWQTTTAAAGNTPPAKAASDSAAPASRNWDANFVGPDVATPVAAAPPDDDVCELSGGSPAATDTRADIERYEPGWIVHSMEGVVGLGCTPRRPNCYARVARNDTASIAEFRGTTIRFNWPRMEAMAAAARMRTDSIDFMLSVTALLAHEYGHYLDAEEQRRWRGRFVEAHPQLHEALPNASWQGELLADAIAACILARSRLSDVLLRRVIDTIANTRTSTHPEPALRKTAMDIGASRCGRTRPDTDLLLTLIE